MTRTKTVRRRLFHCFRRPLAGSCLLLPIGPNRACVGHVCRCSKGEAVAQTVSPYPTPLGMEITAKHQSGGDAIEPQGRPGTASKQADIATCRCRGWAKHVVSRPWFDSAVVGLILVNCVFLALDDPTAEVRSCS